MIIEIVLQEEKVLHRKEQYISGRQNYAKANFAELNKFCGKMNWKELFEDKIVQEKYEIDDKVPRHNRGEHRKYPDFFLFFTLLLVMFHLHRRHLQAKIYNYI